MSIFYYDFNFSVRTRMREDRNFKASDVSCPSVWIFILYYEVKLGVFAEDDRLSRP